MSNKHKIRAAACRRQMTVLTLARLAMTCKSAQKKQTVIIFLMPVGGSDKPRRQQEVAYHEASTSL